MPRVYLTEAQRQQAKYDRQGKLLSDGLACYKALNKLTLTQIGDGVGLSKTTVMHIIQGKDKCVPIQSFWKLLEMAGLEVRRKEAAS
ncbi:hypothetical protein [Lawsonibacter hominis]|uniref:Uncharacterized protein n=1 Tax=Lawsonibacter hominis TaxID=2763053 RepID=A0A8J6J6V3_9FIRM|nr:hypothetical protein [Lawsonibacter hominis]MBC5733801.1 hypothetical protein [Lawsonibacter hominis]